MRLSARPVVLATTLCAAVGLGACDMVNLTVNTTAKVLVRAKPSLQQESDYELAAAALPGTIKTIEGFHIANPDNRTLTGMLAESYCQYASGFLEEGWEQAMFEKRQADAETLARRATNSYIRCMNYGLELLGGSWKKAMFEDIEGVRKLAAASTDVTGMFWVALGLASAINLNRDDIAMVTHLPKARILFERVAQLSPNYYMGLAHVALGSIKTAQGKDIGGDPEGGRAHFETAMKITGGKFLLAKVLFARKYAVITQNRDLYHKTLIEVLQTSPAIWPDQRLANEIAHRKARRYLQQEKELF
jgi:hypothetical protein